MKYKNKTIFFWSHHLNDQLKAEFKRLYTNDLREYSYCLKLEDLLFKLAIFNCEHTHSVIPTNIWLNKFDIVNRTLSVIKCNLDINVYNFYLELLESKDLDNLTILINNLDTYCTDNYEF